MEGVAPGAALVLRHPAGIRSAWMTTPLTDRLVLTSFSHRLLLTRSDREPEAQFIPRTNALLDDEFTPELLCQ